MTERERAEAFARSIRERGEPHSGAIEAYGAEHVSNANGVVGEIWKVGEEHLVEFDEQGVYVYRRGPF